MAPADLPRDIGGFIRDMRHNAKISLRQLAEQAGVSNPYLSQIERGLRKPSAEVLQQLASALRVSTPAMYLKAGLLDGEGAGVLEAIAGDPDLSIAQKQSLSQIYDTFRRENAREPRKRRLLRLPRQLGSGRGSFTGRNRQDGHGRHGRRRGRDSAPVKTARTTTTTTTAEETS